MPFIVKEARAQSFYKLCLPAWLFSASIRATRRSLCVQLLSSTALPDQLQTLQLYFVCFLKRELVFPAIRSILPLRHRILQ